MDPVEEWFQEALGIWRDLGDKWWTSLTLLNMGWRRLYKDDPSSAIVLLEESVASARQANDEWILGSALRTLGATIERVDYAAAGPILEEALLHHKTAGEPGGQADVLKSLATIAWGQGNYMELGGFGQESLELYQEMGDKEDVAEGLTLVARAMLGQEDLEAAAGFCAECMSLAKDIGFHSPIGGALCY